MPKLNLKRIAYIKSRLSDDIRQVAVTAATLGITGLVLPLDVLTIVKAILLLIVCGFIWLIGIKLAEHSATES